MTVAHIVPELRAAHVQRFDDWSPNDEILYRKLKWDNFDFEFNERYSRFEFFPFVLAIFRRRYRIVELPEPLWVREIPFTLLIAILIKCLSLGRTKIVAYCIENNSIEALIGPLPIFRKMVVRIFIWIMHLIIGLTFNRLAFGSPSATEAYKRVVSSKAVQVRQFLELPSPSAPCVPPKNIGILFVGRLESRKGIEPLLRALDLSIHDEGVPVTIVGNGPLAPLVDKWVNQFPSLRQHLPEVSHSQMCKIYRDNRVLVAPSTRDGRWREQIGLPIKEALSYGLTIVTTFESGLSAFLHETDHFVTNDVNYLKDTLDKAVSTPLDPISVISSLPLVDGRRRAHDWLLTP